ncbi:hypothetical protein KP509_14G096500 [Ceratopteris richardii]|nr:hypothetical protein KP509_14G096500 [Ceratopteris richardii]
MHAIDQSIKRHTDTLLQVLESISGRLSQVESTVQALEYTIAELKSTEGGKQDQSNGRLVKLELLIEEVNRGVQLLHEKQKLDEAGLKLTKLQIDEQKPTGGGTMQAPTETWQQLKTIKEDVSQTAYTESSPQRQQYLPPQYPPQMQSHYPQGPSPQGPPPQGPSPPQMQSIPTSHNMVPLPSTMNVSPSPQQTYPPSAVHHPPQQPSTQSVLPAPPPSQQIPAFHSQPPTQQPPNSYSLPGDTAQYSHLQPQHHLPPMSTPLVSSYPTEPSQYTGGMHGGPRPPPIQHEVHLPQQHNPVSSHHVYEATGRMGIPGSSMVPSYPQPSPLSKPALPVQPMHEKTGEIAYGAPYRASQPAPSAPSGGSTGYPRLPTAQPVQHGLPSASPVSSGPPTRPPLDDMIENVANMGFPREQVRGVVRQLTENGQSVDLNVVLDTLMNGRGSSQPPRGWFNRS